MPAIVANRVVLTGFRFVFQRACKSSTDFGRTCLLRTIEGEILGRELSRRALGSQPTLTPPPRNRISVSFFAKTTMRW